ncbi:MAG: hypothetical protein IJU87_09355 [Lachnospiraceae bacterium]|nr:hypothetical protein [Lachnospiraceae bacterium]
MINGISAGFYGNPFSDYSPAGSFGAPVNGVEGPEEVKKPILNPGESTKVIGAHKSSPAECETCKERKYQDGSDEMVSFKSAAHISPEAAPSAVRAHEGEHVSNAYKKAAEGGGKVLQASVRIKTGICPECGRTFVSGGETNTKIEYPNEDKNPYMKNRKAMENGLLSGMNLSLSA